VADRKAVATKVALNRRRPYPAKQGAATCYLQAAAAAGRGGDLKYERTS